MLRWLLPIFFFFITAPLFAQEPLLRHLTDEQGLPTPAVYDVIQDRKGFIWFGTDKGLYRYDGVFFQHYDGSALRGSSVTGLQEDKHGCIWGINFAGQVWHTTVENDGSKKKIQPFTPFDKLFKLGLVSFHITPDDHLYVASEENPLLHFDLRKQTLDSIFYNKNQFFKTTKHGTNHLTIDAQGNLYYEEFGVGIIKMGVSGGKKLVYPIASSTTQVIRLHSADGRIFAFQENKGRVENIVEFKNDQPVQPVWASTARQLLRGSPFCLFINPKDQNVWLGASTGLYHMRPNGVLLHHFLPETTVGNVIHDREGIVWLTTPQDGVFSLPSLSVRVLQPASEVRKLAFDGRSTLYLGTKASEIQNFDLSNGQIKTVAKLPPTNSWQAFNWLNGSKRRGLYTSRQGLWRYDPQKNRLRQLLTVSTDKDFAEPLDDTPAFFSAASFGAKQYTVAQQLTELNFQARRFICTAVNPADSSVWFAGASFALRIKNGEKQTFDLPFQANDLVFSKDGTAWFGTDRMGLVAFKNGQIQQIWDEKRGLIGNRVLKIGQETPPQYDKHFWLVTEGGVQYLNLDAQRFTNFTRANNLLGSTIYDLTLTQNDVCVATSGGLQFFPKNLTQPNLAAQPRVLMEKITVQDQTRALDAPNLTENDGNIELHFIGLSYLSNGRFDYRYRLIGSDMNWTTTAATNPVARFTKLSSGKYTFEVELLSDDGGRSPTVQYAFTIRPIFWRQTWFYGLLSLIILSIVILYYRRIVNRLRQQNQLASRAAAADLDRSRAEEAYRRAQLSALQAQMNPHFLFNALNSIQAYIFLNDKNTANSYLGKFSDLMRTVLEQSQRDTIPLSEEVRTLELYLSLEAMRLRNELSWTIECDPSVNVEMQTIPPLLIQPYIENALKHGLANKPKDREVQAVFSLKNDHLVCQITDNGIGRAAAEHLKQQRQGGRKSFATSATAQRLALLNQGRQAKINVVYEDLTDAAGQASGTRVVIEVPVLH